MIHKLILTKIYFVDLPGPPSAPVADEIFRDSCKLTWSPPETDGGTEITGYFVERSMTGKNRWVRINKVKVTDRSLIVDDLIEGNEYTFRVLAENQVGEGPPGPKSGNIIAKDPWGKN